MKEFLGYSVDEGAATLHMSPTELFQRYVLKYLDTGEVKIENIGRPISFIMHPPLEFVSMKAVMNSFFYLKLEGGGSVIKDTKTVISA